MQPTSITVIKRAGIFGLFPKLYCKMSLIQAVSLAEPQLVTQIFMVGWGFGYVLFFWFGVDFFNFILFFMTHWVTFFSSMSLPSCFGKYCIALAFHAFLIMLIEMYSLFFWVTFPPLVSAVLFNKKYPNTPFAVILPVAFGAHRKVLTTVDRDWILPRLKWQGAYLEVLLEKLSLEMEKKKGVRKNINIAVNVNGERW